jgi:polysaccharide deacetylase 2 family uncharacterized protein YibQ
MAAGWRGLGLFWLAIVVALGGGAIYLQVLGPPATRPPPVPVRPIAAAPRPVPPGRTGAGPIAAPDLALLEPPDGGQAVAGLPRIGADGDTPMHAYAAGFDPATKAPRIALVVAGIGLDAVASQRAIAELPPPVTLAISPYAPRPDAILASARQAGHEYLLSIPMEPQGYPRNDPGVHALLTSATPQQNMDQLNWALSRMAGYVGVTGALGEMRGERFAGVADQMDPVLAAVAARGLLYVDPRPGAAPPPDVWACDVDVVIDDPPVPANIDARLAELEKRAHDTGRAVGLVGAVHAATIDHLSAWAGNLGGRGAVLAPISALVRPPAGGKSTGAASE